MKYRIVQVPQIGDDKYQVEGLEIADKESTEKWRIFDRYGFFWVNWGIHGGISLSTLELFVSEESAKKWIKDHLEFQDKKSKVIYESDWANKE